MQLQVSAGSAYAAIASELRTARATLVAPRGAILDRDGNPLAHSVPAIAIYADPKYVKDPDAVAGDLSDLIGIAPSELAAKLGTKKSDKGDAIRFTYLARGLDPEVGQAVTELELPGVYVLPEQRRDAPGHDLAANLIGFTGTDGYGLAGLEASFDDVLRGTDGKREFEVGARGQEIPDGYRKETKAKPGKNVQLTIDSDLQFATQKVLSSALDSAGAYLGAAIVLDVKTGEILSMASYPTYDAANPASSTPESRGNVATSTVIEPGSIHKAITFAAGLSEGVINESSVLTVPGSIDKGGETFTDTHSHETVGMTLQGMLAQSSNVGTIMIADELGADKLYKYQRAFGLGESCQTGLEGESTGIVQAPDRWSGPSYGGIPIGLGVATTPLQMTSVYATVANDGVRMSPTLLSDPGTKKASNKERGERVISADNARVLRESLEAVTTTHGTAPKAAVPGYRVAGKTGTGQRVVDDKYAPGDVTSFVGMVPADAPRYAIGIFAHVPRGSGGGIAGPAFSELASFTLRHYGVAPTGTPSPEIRIYA